MCDRDDAVRASDDAADRTADDAADRTADGDDPGRAIDGDDPGRATDGGTADGGRSRTDRMRLPADDRPHVSTVERQGTPYMESQVIMTAVRFVAPFVFLFGLFVTFHGAGAPGGGFQGGAIIAAVVFMIAFAFGIDSTRRWLRNSVLVGAAAAGVVVFGGTGLVTIAYGGGFLEYVRLPVPHGEKWGMELIEIGGVMFIVAAVLVGLFFVLAVGSAALDTEVEP